MGKHAKSVEVIEVGPRDGLQNEQTIVSLDDKLTLISGLIEAGVKRLEVASFVNPKRVPQMANAEALIEALPSRDGITIIGLVLNIRGVERALMTNIDEIGAVVLPSDTFALKNQGQTSAESVCIGREIIQAAKASGRAANVTISAAFGCPFEGEIDHNRIVEIALELAEAEPHEIAVADTIGVGDPWRVAALVSAIRTALPQMPLRAHFHNTRNTGLANAHAAVQAGVTRLDASLGGIGGCPFAPAATGNIPTEDLVYMLARGGIATDVSLERLISLTSWLSSVLGKQVPAMVSRAGGFPPTVSKTKTNPAA